MSNYLAVIQGDVYGTRDNFLALQPEPKIFEAEAGFAIQILSASEYAMKVAMDNRQSVVNAVTNIAAIGISLNPARKQAYLVPRDGKICLDISYIGLLDIAIEAGAILWGQAELVYKNDPVFELDGIDKPPIHKRNPFATDRGELIGAYCVVKTPSGDYLTCCMSIAEVYDIRDRSSAWKAWINKQKKCPWVTDEGEMIKKVVIKRAYKTWPHSEKTEKIEKAVHYLNNEGGEGIEVAEVDPLDQPKNFGLTVERAKVIRNAARSALQKFNEGDEFGAYEEVSWIDDNEEKEALWSILKPHSALRSSLKRHAAEERARQAEIDTAATPKPEQEQ